MPQFPKQQDGVSNDCEKEEKALKGQKRIRMLLAGQEQQQQLKHEKRYIYILFIYLFLTIKQWNQIKINCMKASFFSQMSGKANFIC